MKRVLGVLFFAGMALAAVAADKPKAAAPSDADLIASALVGRAISMTTLSPVLQEEAAAGERAPVR